MTLQYTPTPDGGFPPIIFASADQPLNLIEETTRATWAAIKQPKTLIQIFGFNGASPHGRLPILNYLLHIHLSAICNNTPAHHITITPPIPAETTTTPDRIAKSFLAYGFDPEDLTTLRNQRIWSFKDVSFHIVDFPDTPSRLHIATLVAKTPIPPSHLLLTLDAIWFATPTRKLLTNALPPPSRNENTTSTDMLRTSLQIEQLTFPDPPTPQNQQPHHAIYSISAVNTSPDPTIWKNIRQILHSNDLKDALDRLKASLITKITCTICHGATHSAKNCPFPHVPLWNGPIPISAPRPLPISLTVKKAEHEEEAKRKLERELELLYEAESMYV